jgi:hypothetical protein
MDSLFKVGEVYGTYVNPNCTNKYAPRRESTEECKPGDFFGCLGQSWQMLNLADFSHTSASGQLMADGAIYDIYASQDAFELKPSLTNKVAMDLQGRIELVEITQTARQPPLADGAVGLEIQGPAVTAVGRLGKIGQPERIGLVGQKTMVSW